MQPPAFRRAEASSNACEEADPPERSIGIWPTARKNRRVFHDWKYSALATKVTRLGTTNGRKSESQNAWWLAAMMIPPAGGMFSLPVARMRKLSRNAGVRIALMSP